MLSSIGRLSVGGVCCGRILICCLFFGVALNGYGEGVHPDSVHIPTFPTLGWISAGNGMNTQAEIGKIRTTFFDPSPDAFDPYFTNTTQIDTSAVRFFYMRIRMGGTTTSDPVPFGTYVFGDSIDFAEYTVVPNGNWQTIQVDLAQLSNWEGICTIRIDPANGDHLNVANYQNAWLEIDWIVVSANSYYLGEYLDQQRYGWDLGLRDYVWDTYSDTWAAVDGLGRVVPENPTTGGLRADKQVAVFYYIWHGQHGTGIYDITKILAENPENPQWGPPGAFHFWMEPLYGYYLPDDEYVIRKNAQMLADAGVDVIFFDATNAFTYRDMYMEVCRVYREIRAEGGRTPHIGFLTHSSSGTTSETIYADLYGAGKYRDLWFFWNDEPIILARESELPQELKDFFTVRFSWAWDPGQDRWPWLEHYPQQGGWHTSPSQLEQMVAATAQHPFPHNSGLGIGKSFHAGVQPPPGSYEPEVGHCFAEQLERVLQADPELMFITQWNEWVAQRFLADGPMTYAGLPLEAGDSYFVDGYSIEFNRDIEPMKGGYGDNYYYQLVSAIRRFKGTRTLPEPSSPRRIIPTNLAAWDEVTPEYRDDRHDTVHRNHAGWGGLEYTDQTGRNDFVVAKVARDHESISFYVECQENLTTPQEPSWMNLLIRLEDSSQPDWEGYHFLVRPNEADPASGMVLHQFDAGGFWTPVTPVDSYHTDNKLVVRIERATLGLPTNTTAADILFKWRDNQAELDPESLILNGDTAPNGRFCYRYAANAEEMETSSAIQFR